MLASSLKEKARRFLLTEVLVMGDSHASIFKKNTLKKRFPFIRFSTISIGGATVSGLKNPNSKTQARTTYFKALDSTKAKLCLLLLGEVDTGFVIWYRAQNNGSKISDSFNNAVENYKILINRCNNKLPTAVISTPLPTIKDHTKWQGDIANARKNITASLQERINLTLEFNQTIENFCKKESIGYVSLDKDTLGPDHTVKEALLHKNDNDHHYDDDEYARILHSHLKPVLKSLKRRL